MSRKTENRLPYAHHFVQLEHPKRSEADSHSAPKGVRRRKHRRLSLGYSWWLLGNLS